MDGIDVGKIVLMIILIVCYSIGIVVIFNLKKKKQAKTQHILWLNVSIFVILSNIVYILSTVIHIFTHKRVALYLETHFYVFNFFQTFGTIYITIDST